ncbi:hypothetical protein CY34DRAFT_7793 [Suillus luteus UH-Slu-Lm8-n1]|uniref:Uncharacterized protein n=1 Tax=Suillus luteus UH-Slu-Lm8-n1 TaxID=930992 RepID=A0A0D0BHR1_9AGAM|nr:hypothetical protein CY34DRAFT_7793 [Suillus luteus UH-Slu-Lm8-n1]
MATITDEITFIWCRPKALSAMLFFANRYVALFGNAYMLYVYLTPSDEVLGFNPGPSICVVLLNKNPSCQAYFVCRELLIFFQQILVCLILALRTYALYCRSKRLLTWMIIILCSLGGVTAGTSGLHSDIVPGFNCFESLSEKIAVSPGLGWVTLLAYELLIFVLTVHRICKTRGLSLAMSRRNILDIIFQDGAMYFAVMTLSNLPNILTYYCGSVSTHPLLMVKLTNYFWRLTRIPPEAVWLHLLAGEYFVRMSVTLVSRLMLNLHKSVDTGILSTSVRDDDYDSAVVFTTIINAQSTISSSYC